MEQALLGNLAVVALFISGWVHAQHWLETRRRRVRRIAFGILMGLGAIASMRLSVNVGDGVLIDFRTSLVALASFFGGPVAALISVTMAVAFRVATGGSGVTGGAIGILSSSAIGLLGYYLSRRGRPTCLQALSLSVAAAAIPLIGAFAVPSALVAEAMLRHGLPVLALRVAVTFGAACLIRRGMQTAEERGLLYGALEQAPHFLYVKNTNSEFLAVNRAVAAYNGFSHPSEMQGRSDFDLSPPDRAQALYEAEQQIVRSGKPLVNFEEHLVDAAGQPRWFTTSKAPIRNADGEIVGVAGVTKDISERKALEAELRRSRNQLSYVLTEMSDGLALFDQQGTLVFCNEQYRFSFPLTAAMRRPGTHIRDILRAVVATGEQRGVPETNTEAWIDEIAASLHAQSEQEIEMADGRWVQIRRRPTSDGYSVVVVSDVTTNKKAELALFGMTEQLKHLATTDSLTGLLNRRAFDEALERELSRSTRERTPISLLLIDVDRFKAFNDYYGHPAGDGCLRAISQSIRSVLRRPGDLVARYGGEEFVVILPNTDEDGAFIIASLLRTSLRELQLQHVGSEKKVVTVSIGIASYSCPDALRRSTELLARADEALYDAKAAGRDRVTGWQNTQPVNLRSVSGGKA